MINKKEKMGVHGSYHAQNRQRIDSVGNEMATKKLQEGPEQAEN